MKTARHSLPRTFFPSLHRMRFGRRVRCRAVRGRLSAFSLPGSVLLTGKIPQRHGPATDAAKLKGLTVFVFVFIFQHGKIAVVPAFGDIVLLHRFPHGTARLVRVRAVGEAAVL